MSRQKIILRQRMTMTEISTGCQYNDWEWTYRFWPHWFEKHVVVRLLWKRHKRHCIHDWTSCGH